MLGEVGDLEFKPSPNRGMMPRIFEFLFARIQAVILLWYSFYHIYYRDILTLLIASCFIVLVAGGREQKRRET